MMKKNMFIIVSLIVVMSMLAITGCVSSEGNLEEISTVTDENKLEKLEELNIDLYDWKPVKGEVPEREEESTKTETINYEMPDISNYEPIVNGAGDLDVEIFLPLEENGSGIQELMKFAGQRFNESRFKSKEGKTISVTIRSLESALAEDFIKSGAYVPKGYIASNELYGALMQASGIDAKIIYQKLVGNTMGLAITQEKFDELFSNTKITSKDIVKSNLEGNLKIGYTNPTNNPTGLNFVVSMLSGFDEANPNSMEATTDFTEFQEYAKVCYSTKQLLKAAKNGEINAFVIEHQAFETNQMDKQFVFIPFGMRHDYPLYHMAETDEKEMDALIEFGKFCQRDEVKNYATDLNFDKDSDYESSISMEKYPVGTILEILEFWKKNKTAGKQIVAVFVADISGSMNSKHKRENLGKSLKTSMKYIDEEAKIGLIAYDHNVYRALPIGTFDYSHQEYFAGAVDNVIKRNKGGTATNDALCMAVKMLYEEENKNKEIKPIIILLSDGWQESGYSLRKVKDIIRAFGYPIYTIGYGNDADEKELQDIANINGGIFINSSTEDVGYTIKTLFNAEM